MERAELLKSLKVELREAASPFFTEEELGYYLDKNKLDLDKTIYECALLKAEDDSISLPGGLTIPNNKSYWIRLAMKHKKSHSGVR